MAILKELDLEQLHTAITDTLLAKYPAFQTVQAYREESNRRTLSLPAMLFELSELDANDETDAGTGQQSVMARFEARIIIGFRTPQAKIEIRKLSAALCAFLRVQNWGMGEFGVGPATVLGAYPDEFNDELDQYEVWRIEWQQELHLGTNEWAGEGVVPGEVLYSYEPETGPPNEDEYTDIAAVSE